MAFTFNNFGDLVFLAQGGRTGYVYNFAGGDVGFVQAGADIKTRNGAAVMATAQGKSLPAAGGALYFLDFENRGPGSTIFNIQGAGA